MELQKYISENNDYLNQFKEHKLYVRKYSNYGLCIVKGYYNKEYDYENHPWIKYCRGAVIDIKNNNVLCVPPEKALEKNLLNVESPSFLNVPDNMTFRNIDDIINQFDENLNYEPLFDGTMINMFYHNDEWMISTRSNIGAKNMGWKGKFLKMFLEVNGDEWFNNLNKQYCYSFVLHHINNRNVSPIQENTIFLIENHEIKDGIIKKKPLDEIENIQNMFQLTKDMLSGYKSNLIFSIKGFTIKGGDKRINWINPNFEYVKSLKMNHNDKYLNYISLKQKRLLSQYLLYFPEDRFTFDEYRDEFNKIKMLLYSRYVSRFIKKEIENKDIEYPLKPLVYELHEHYKQSGEKINMKIVSDYMHKLDGKKIMFIRNYLKDEQ